MSHSPLEKKIKSEQFELYESPASPLASPKREDPNDVENYGGLNPEVPDFKSQLDEICREMQHAREFSVRCLNACVEIVDQFKTDFLEMKQQLATLQAESNRITNMEGSASDNSFSSNSSTSSCGPTRFPSSREQASTRSWRDNRSGFDYRRLSRPEGFSHQDSRHYNEGFPANYRHQQSDRSRQYLERRPFASTNNRGYRVTHKTSSDSRRDNESYAQRRQKH